MPPATGFKTDGRCGGGQCEELVAVLRPEDSCWASQPAYLTQCTRQKLSDSPVPPMVSDDHIDVGS